MELNYESGKVFGYINTAGNVIVPIEYSNLGVFSDRLAYAAKKKTA